MTNSIPIPAARFMSAQVLPVGGATPATDCASRGSQASYSLAAASSGISFAGALRRTPSREGGECCPAHIQAFVDTWVSAPHRPEPVARDYSFKAVIGEPSW